MDNITISTLKDIQESIDKNFGEIDKKIKSYNKAEKREKNSIKKSIKKNLDYIKNNKSQMKTELNYLKNEENKIKWEKIFNEIDSKIKEYELKIDNLDSIQVENEEEKNDYLDPDAKVDLNELNVEQAMKRGDVIQDANDDAIDNIGKIVNKDIDVMKDVNKELERQKDQFDVADAELKEIDFSINRARKKITSLFKLYASDKCITCLIVVIMLIIVTIIIVSACGGDNKNNFNVPHDIFGTNNKTSSTSDSHYLIKSFNLMRIFGFMALFLF